MRCRHRYTNSPTSVVKYKVARLPGRGLLATASLFAPLTKITVDIIGAQVSSNRLFASA